MPGIRRSRRLPGGGRIITWRHGFQLQWWRVVWHLTWYDFDRTPTRPESDR